MSKLLLGLLFVSGVAMAENEMAFVGNNAGGFMFFTFSECVFVDSGKRIPNKYYVYSTDARGARIADGCFEFKNPFYIVDWNSGNRSSIPVDTVRLIGR